MAFQTVPRPSLARRHRQSDLWPDQTFFSILAARADAHPGREAFADRAGRITYGELRERVERCAAFLRWIGIGRGDVITIQLPNRIAFPIVFFALELIGAVANKVNPDFRTRELEYILRFSDSQAFICAREFKGFDYVAMARELARHAPLAATERVAMGPDEIFRMAFTSGTTGDPKCVLHSFNTTLPAVYRLNADMTVTEADALLGA